MVGCSDLSLILVRAGKVAGGVSNEPPRAPGSDKTRDQGSFGPLTGGLILTSTGEPPTYRVTQRVTGQCLVTAWSQGGFMETLPRWHATIPILTGTYACKSEWPLIVTGCS